MRAWAREGMEVRAGGYVGPIGRACGRQTGAAARRMLGAHGALGTGALCARGRCVPSGGCARLERVQLGVAATVVAPLPLVAVICGPNTAHGGRNRNFFFLLLHS